MGYLVQLNCLFRHSIEYPTSPPKVGEIVWDRKCQKYVEVAESIHEWRIRCRSCRYGRKFGSAKITAEARAAQHRARYPWHTVEIINGHKVMDVYAPSEGTLPPHALTDGPQF